MGRMHLIIEDHIEEEIRHIVGQGAYHKGDLSKAVNEALAGWIISKKMLQNLKEQPIIFSQKETPDAVHHE